MSDEAATDHPGLWEPLACHLVGLSDKQAFIQNMHDYLPLACPVLMASRFDEHAAKYGVHTKSAWEVVSDQTGKAVRVTTVLVGTDVRLSTLFRARSVCGGAEDGGGGGAEDGAEDGGGGAEDGGGGGGAVGIQVE